MGHLLRFSLAGKTTLLKSCLSISIISMLSPYYELFLHLSIHVHLRNQLDKLIHNAYNLHNLLFEVLKQFDLLYNHPMKPFLERL